MPVGRVIPETSGRVRKPWTGKVHNPRAIWEREQNEKRNLTQADFIKFTKEGIDQRFNAIEKRQATVETMLAEVLAALKK